MTLKIFRASSEGDVSAIPMATALDEQLSYAARGLLFDILSRPDGWDANADDLSQAARAARGDARGEGRRAVRALFAELEAAGYMRRIRRRRASGEFFTDIEVTGVPNEWGDPLSGIPRTPFPTQGQSQVVYAIGPHESGVVKIGTTDKARSRLKQIQTGHPHKLHVQWSFGGGSELEDYLHTRFAHLRLEGEWFDFGDEDPVTTISAAVDAYYLVPSGTCATWS